MAAGVFAPIDPKQIIHNTDIMATKAVLGCAKAVKGFQGLDYWK